MDMWSWGIAYLLFEIFTSTAIHVERTAELEQLPQAECIIETLKSIPEVKSVDLQFSENQLHVNYEIQYQSKLEKQFSIDGIVRFGERKSETKKRPHLSHTVIYSRFSSDETQKLVDIARPFGDYIEFQLRTNCIEQEKVTFIERCSRTINCD